MAPALDICYNPVYCYFCLATCIYARERNTIMPRGIKGSGPNAINRVNNGPVDVPNPPSVDEKIAATNAALESARVYKSTGKPTPPIPDRPFGPGADYPRKTWTCRLFDPANGATYVFSMSDVEREIWQGEIDRAVESGLRPNTAPDAPQAAVARVPVADEPEDDEEEDERPQRPQRPTSRRSGGANTVLTFGQYEGKTIRQVYNSGRRGESYVEWLADNARDRDVRNAARDVIG